MGGIALLRSRSRLVVALLGAAVIAAGALALLRPSGGPAAETVGAARAERPVYATLLFSRTEIAAADACVFDARGVARLDTVVAPYLAGLGMAGTGTLTTSRTAPSARTCVHSDQTMAASWADVARLGTSHGWSFVSHTATWPTSLSTLTAQQSYAETCGSAATLDAHAVKGGHGLIAYPGAQAPPSKLQAAYSANCFAWGRQYSSTGVTRSAAGTTAPYWQYTKGINGGACNVESAPCYTVSSVGNPRTTCRRP